MFASDFKRSALVALSGNWLLAVGTGLVASILNATSGSGGILDINLEETSDGFNSIWSSINARGFEGIIPFFYGAISLALFWTLVTFVLGSAIQIGYCKFNIGLINNTGAEIDDLFSYFKILGKALLLRLLSGLYIFLWSLLFIIPGIIAAYRYAMAPYIMAEDTLLTASEAIDRSKEMMIGNKWRLFCLEISFIGWIILATLSFGIGFLWLTPYMEAARAAFYIDLRGDNEGEQGEESADFI